MSNEKAVHLHTPHEHRIAATRLLNEAENQQLASSAKDPLITDVLLAAVVHALLAQRP